LIQTYSYVYCFWGQLWFQSLSQTQTFLSREVIIVSVCTAPCQDSSPGKEQSSCISLCPFSNRLCLFFFFFFKHLSFCGLAASILPSKPFPWLEASLKRYPSPSSHYEVPGKSQVPESGSHAFESLPHSWYLCGLGRIFFLLPCKVRRMRVRLKHCHEVLME
jgi:hypothetical protein